MLKNRSLLIGLGIGLILGTLMLQLMNLAEEQGMELSQYAQEGVQEQQLYTQQQLTEQLEEQRAALTKAEAEAAEAVEALAAAELKAAEPDPLLEQAKQLVRVIRIRRGTGLEQTAEMLANYGLVADQQQFMQSMSKRSREIRSGVFYFTGFPSEDEVREIITSDPTLTHPAN
ncbi:hypothetical protein EBB07_32035 [Paenibacillaceae bacterium]|nr:hypothetical protein EBB07_32035 [Paenibacillaceae bacterium]